MSFTTRLQTCSKGPYLDASILQYLPGCRLIKYSRQGTNDGEKGTMRDSVMTGMAGWLVLLAIPEEGLACTVFMGMKFFDVHRDSRINQYHDRFPFTQYINVN